MSSAWPSFDVFINFRGGDTRRNVASLLHAELCRRKILTYIDDRVLDKGYEIGASLRQAIEKSRVDVFVNPENYAYPKWWCFDELVEIMDYKKTEQIIYRDFKASNILLDGNYNPKISDFELARFDFHRDTESMALGGLASNNKDKETSKVMNNANKETSQKSEDPEMGFKMNASIFQSQSPTKGNNHDEDSNPFGLSGSIQRSPKKRKENMGKFCSSLATFSFPLFMFLTILGHPLKETQGSLVSILVSSLAMFDLIAFIFAVSVMILVRWRFTWVQIATMLISAMAIRVGHSNLVISVLFMLAPLLAIVLVAVEFLSQNSQLVPH